MIESDEHVKLLKEELARNEETISSLRARNIDITIRLIAYAWGISVGDIVRARNGTEYKVCRIDTRVPVDHDRPIVKPWLVGHPRNKDGTAWIESSEINLYASWEKVA